MKKILTLLLGIMIILSLAGCKKQAEPEPVVEPEPEPEPTADVVTYEEYKALPTDGSAVVTIEAYVQGVQSYWDGGATFYLQDKDGGYLAYAAKIVEEDYTKIVSNDFSEGWVGLANGMKVRVEGTKSEWSGEEEIVDGVVTLVDDGDKWIAEAVDVTNYMATDATVNYMNQRVKFTDLTVAAYNDAGDAFSYSWDGSGTPGDDLYFNCEKDGLVYSFVVESSLCFDGSPAYEAVEALEVGQTVDIEGFLYWYNGAQPHVVSLTVK